MPSGYQEFLLQHNGAILFQDQSGEYLAESWMLFGTDEIEGFLSERGVENGMFPIAKYGQTMIFVSSELVNQGQNDYLFDGSVYARPNTEIDGIHLNFELFLERLLVSQGATFWFWSHLNGTN